MPRNKKFVSYLVITTFLAFGFSISLQSLLAAWTAPTVSPPTDNINRPLTEGSDSQVKLGNLSLYNNLYVGDGVSNDVFFVDNANSKVGIGTINPTQKLTVDGVIDVMTHKIVNLAAPTQNTDAATKAYVDAAAGGGCYISYSGSCLPGFTNKGSIGTWGYCVLNASHTYFHYRPPGGSCSGWGSGTHGQAYVCCQ